MNTVPPPRTRRESFADGLSVRIDERGSGRPILVLHGGGGPQTVSGLAEALSTRAHVLVPTHPGFAGEPRPEWFDGIDDLALTYLDLLERLDLRDVMVIGSSVGGWIASELAVRDTTRLSSIVLVDAIVRLLPEALGHEQSAVDDSFNQGLLEAPQYTRPAEFRGWKVPEVLLSGNHAEIEKWRKKEALRRTRENRPDLLDD